MFIKLMSQRVSPIGMLRRTVEQEGARVLLRGIGPRILWISAGGAVFLGAYEFAKDVLLAMRDKVSEKRLDTKR
jgi:solute carrier family 25 (mitochondrial S-adenosylmethionine transporter), member 26